MLTFAHYLTFFCILMLMLALVTILYLISKIKWYKERFEAYAILIDNITNLEDSQKVIRQLEAEVENYKFEAESYRQSFQIAKQSLEKMKKDIKVLGPDTGIKPPKE